MLVKETNLRDRTPEPLEEFYSVDANMRLFLSIIILKTKKIPLRVFEWFVTNYAKKNDIRYDILKYGKVETFIVYQSYQAQLKGLKKTNFDPFCRGASKIIKYVYPDTNESILFESSLKQLAFFKWAIENKIIDYIELHYTEIYKDMEECLKNKTERTGKNLSKSIYKCFHSSENPVEFKI